MSQTSELPAWDGADVSAQHEWASATVSGGRALPSLNKTSQDVGRLLGHSIGDVKRKAWLHTDV